MVCHSMKATGRLPSVQYTHFRREHLNYRVDFVTPLSSWVYRCRVVPAAKRGHLTMTVPS